MENMYPCTIVFEVWRGVYLRERLQQEVELRGGPVPGHLPRGALLRLS